MASPTNPIPNIEYLGACFNVVSMDPLSLASTALTKTIFDFGKTRSDSSFSVPDGVAYRTILKTSYDWATSVVSSAAELQTTLKQSAEASAGLEGAFEFSGSASYKDITNQTESRKRSFVYARALVELVAVSADIDDTGSGLKLEDSFRRAVADLPTQHHDAGAAVKLQDFIRRFGTHFAWHVTLGGMATQRTSGLSSRFLKSSDAQSELKAKAKVVIEQIKAGVGVEQAQASVRKSDDDDKIERTRLEFQGGTGSIQGIDDNWVKSLKGEPTMVAAKLRKITDLMTARFFPLDSVIALKQGLLEYATREWIVENGEPGMFTAPLAYGESVHLMFKLGRTGVYQPPILASPPTQRNFCYRAVGTTPIYDSAEPTNVVIESPETRQNRQILAGDEVVLKHGPSGMYLKLGGNTNSWNSGKSGATRLVMLHAGDSPMGPRRVGEYVTESDPVVFVAAPLGTSASGLSVSASGGHLMLGQIYDFKLDRWDPSED